MKIPYKKIPVYYAVAVLFSFVFVSIFAPLIANSRPLVYADKGKIIFPALFDYSEYNNFDFKNAPGFKIFPPIKYNYSEYDLDSVVAPPSADHYFGTDEQGRDIAARMIYGTRNSFIVSLIAVIIYLSIGIVAGSFAGYFGGIVDIILSRIIEVVICFPVLFFILALTAIFTPGLITIMVVIGLTGWTSTARVVRGEFFKIKNSGYVLAARAAGAGDFRIIFRHILPNALPPVIVIAVFGLASAVLIESSLSFLGFGVQPPSPSWGDILSQSRDFFDFAWWLMFIPGGAIFAVISSYNILGRHLQNRYESNSR
ncbi:MAG TPA: ABC transporter permease [Spirochaetota bacterium]|jgi:peptide/nickel transport system permease protein|nr:ABC transporter permease [Spirochaetota bacterium]HOH36791.1 ABC transporter permease [Spirochaetota bacterium]HPJ15062.1 ABC transporter permease [Spirochaetota bacterium]HPM33441.1 ABC transporter permease [Spirochaetota bacterium]HPW51145.1 ABC transporter permease [Spirochaetota bacterium]